MSSTTRNQVRTVQIIQALAKRAGVSNGEQGYSLPLVIAAALILIAGTAVLANRAGMGLLSSVFQNQSWEAKEAAVIGMTQIVSELNKETNRYLMVQRPGDTGDGTGIWTASSNAFIKATRTNPCSGATEASYSNLDSRTPSPAADTSYGTWYIQNDGEVTRTQGSATRGFKLSYVKRQAINQYGSPLNIYTSRPSGTGEMTLQVEGFVYRNGTQVASAKLEKVFELVPKCCKVSFGAAHGGLNYSISYGASNDETLCLNSAASLGLGLVAGAGLEGGSMTLTGSTSVKDTSSANVSPVICIVTPSNSCTGTTNGAVTTQIAKVDITLPPVKTYDQAYTTASSTAAGGTSSSKAELVACSGSQKTVRGTKTTINTCNSNSSATQEETSETNRLTNFTYCADGLQGDTSCDYTVINGDVATSKLPPNCVISGGDLHCNITKLTYDKMVVATGTRKVILYFPNGDVSSNPNDWIISARNGNSWIKNCPVASTSIATGANALNCSSATGANIARLSLFGCATNTCTPSTPGTQTVSLQGGTGGVGMFTYFPEGTMKLNGTPTYQGIMWGRVIDAGGNVNFIIPAGGLASVCQFMGVCRSDENSGTGTGQLPSYDFVARATNRYRWL